MNLSISRVALSASRAEPEDVKSRGADMLAVFAVAIAPARVVALILLTVPFACVT